MRKTILTALLLLVSASALAYGGCIGILQHTEIFQGYVACTYRLNNGETVRVIYTGAYNCPVCLE